MEPLADKKSLLGTVELKLPCYSGRFAVAYVRSSHKDKSKTVLAISEPVLIPLQIHAHAPDGPFPGRRRRAVGLIQLSRRMSFLIEDLRNIRVLSFCLSLVEESDSLNRLMAWFHDVGDMSQLTIEADIIATDGSCQTQYAVFRMERRTCGLNSAMVSIDSEITINCRIPYVADVLKQEGEASEESTVKLLSASSTSLCCKFCRNQVMSLNAIEEVKPLPSGIFDNVSPLCR